MSGRGQISDHVSDYCGHAYRCTTDATSPHIILLPLNCKISELKTILANNGFSWKISTCKIVRIAEKCIMKAESEHRFNDI